MGHKHSKTEILEGALATAFADGLSELTFGRVAKRLGISDRVVVYYFPTKDDLVGEVLLELGLRLQTTLAPAFATPAADHIDLARKAWPILAHPDADPVFALFFEASGLAAIGRAPYRQLMPLIVQAWVDWSTNLLSGPAPRRRTEAATSVAVIDGLLMFRHLAGPEMAEQAARLLGVAGRRRRR